MRSRAHLTRRAVAAVVASGVAEENQIAQRLGHRPSNTGPLTVMGQGVESAEPAWLREDRPWCAAEGEQGEEQREGGGRDG